MGGSMLFGIVLGIDEHSDADFKAFKLLGTHAAAA